MVTLKRPLEPEPRGVADDGADQVLDGEREGGVGERHRRRLLGPRSGRDGPATLWGATHSRLQLRTATGGVGPWGILPAHVCTDPITMSYRGREDNYVPPATGTTRRNPMRSTQSTHRRPGSGRRRSCRAPPTLRQKGGKLEKSEHDQLRAHPDRSARTSADDRRDRQLLTEAAH
jgi:hypothetical protein